MRKFEALPDTKINAVYDDALPRFLDVFDEFDVKATFFVVGKDARSVGNQTRIREIVDRGHEIANHTYHHHQHFGECGRQEKVADIVDADKILSDVIGGKIHGFRPPNWGVDGDVIQTLESLGYGYVSSVFPSRAVSVINSINWFLNGGQMQRVKGNTIEIGKASKLPYHPDVERPWRRGQSSILEMPRTVLPILQLPFLGTLLFFLGKSFFRSSYAWFRMFPRPLLYEVHGIQLLDYFQTVRDERLKAKPGMGWSVERKMDTYRYMLRCFRRNYEFTTMNRLQELYSRESSSSMSAQTLTANEP